MTRGGGHAWIGGRLPQAHHFPHLQSRFPFFFKTRTTNTHNHKKQPRPLVTRKWPARVAGRAGRGRGRIWSVAVCASRSSRRWAGARLAPPATASQGRQARSGHGRAGRALGEGAGTEFKTMVHVVMQYPRWAPRGGEGWTPRPPARGPRRGWCPSWVGRWDSCNSRGWGEEPPGRTLA